MRYKFTLLKDLPDCPAGTEFHCCGLERDSWNGELLYDVHFGVEACLGLNKNVGGVLDNPAWFRKEIDEERLNDLACPECGHTRGVFFSYKYSCRDMDRDDYGEQFSVGFECSNCGHKRILYGTKYGNEKLKEQLEHGLIL